MKAPAVVLAMLLWIPGSLSADAQENQGAWGDSTSYHQYDRFFFAGQPDEDGLAGAAAEGVSIVINLRGLEESDWDEASAAGTNGLEYHQVPVNGGAPELSKAPFAEINEIVAANPDARILLHCASGNRAAAWLAYYLSEVEGLDSAGAIEAARANGLTSKRLESRIEALLED